MRSRQLETALTEFVAQAAERLQAEIDGGAEVGFELSEKSARRGESAARLYSYRALTAAFIEEHATKLASLPAHAEAVSLLVDFDGLDRYLATSGAGAAELARMKAYARADAALRWLLGDVFDERTDFDLRSDATQHDERLEAALARLEHSTQASTSEVTLLASLHGLTIASEEIALTRGLTIAQPDALRGVPDGAPLDGLLVVFSADERDVEAGLARGREVLKDLLRALRLFGDGRVTLGALAWARLGAGAWNPLALGAGGRPHGMLVVSAEQEDELRGFCNLVSRRAPHGNELSWALRRFELGCERETGYEALSDHLLALRALLEPEGPASGLLAGRIAALCATPEERAKLTKRMLKAQTLERATIAGSAEEHTAGLNLAREVADHLRALLRDVICGHLDPNLVALADELLAAPAPVEPTEDADAVEAQPDVVAVPEGHPLDQLTQSALPV
ncbi:MAG TPA: hypothetical protein VGL54_09335 [Solirubrobacteraceae bacterium]|jgi:hypothetical protein